MSSVLNIVLATTGGAAVLNSLGGIHSVLGGIAAAATSTTAALTGIQGALDLGGQLTDLQARTGQTAGDLVIARRAFDNAGIGAANTAPMIGLLQKAISGLNEEGGKTDGVFERLGTSSEALKSMSALDQMRTLTRAFEGIKDPSERAAIAMQLFGRSGAQMLQLLGDSSALSTAEREVGRLAMRASENAAKFDEVGDRLSLAKLRLQEFFVVAAEKAIPSLERMADLIDRFNPSVLGAGLGNALAIASALGGAAFVKKLDTYVLDWATKQGAPIGQKFVGSFLAPLTGSLARVLPIGLALVIANEVMLGITNGYAEWRNQNLTAANAGFDATRKTSTSARAIRTEPERLAALADAQAQIPAAEAGLAAAKDRWFFNRDEGEINSYAQQLGFLRAQVKLLSGEWSQHTMALNRASDAAKANAAVEAEAAEFLKSDAAEKMRDDIIAAERAALGAKDRVDFTRTELGLHDQSFAAERAKYDLEKDAFKLAQLDLKAGAGRLDILKRLTDAQAALNDERKTELATELAKLDADFTRTDADKWAKRRELLDAAIKSQQTFIADQAKLAAGAEAKGDTIGAGIFTANKAKGEGDLRDLRGQEAGMGADPRSFAEQMVAATVGAQNQIGSIANQLGRLWGSTAESMRSSMGTAFADMVLKAQSFHDASIGFIRAVGVGFIQNSAQMLADWIMNHGVMAAVKAAFTTTDVAAHAAGEAAKTGISATGAVARKGINLGETLFSVAQWIIRTTAHLIGETTNTAVTLVQTAIRLPLILLETGAFLAKAAIGAMSAMASIPYVGPVLAIAAMGAIVAAGSKVMHGFESGGATGGQRGRIAGFVHGEEFVFSAPAVDAIGVDNLRSAHEAALAGDSGAAASAIGGGAGEGIGGSGLDLRAALNDFAGRITLIQVNSEVEATRIARRGRAAGDVVQIVRDNFPEITKRGPRGG